MSFICGILAVEEVFRDPVFRADDHYFLSREKTFDRVMEKSAHFVKRLKELNITDEVDRAYFRL